MASPEVRRGETVAWAFVTMTDAGPVYHLGDTTPGDVLDIFENERAERRAGWFARIDPEADRQAASNAMATFVRKLKAAGLARDDEG